ncbi:MULTISPECIES: hypothetical protein [unclassified Streptomyces]|uniref:hypothetical protein n=1 Tax=unclassified Streptomyces TaxID=2593676 RepID=UPI00093C61D0|nr:hypothetical protein [Streptomyces sp. TSRI0281]OKI34976.1 hypothetical protein A6A29_16250 [Streptomyces sp. TSRI0281]
MSTTVTPLLDAETRTAATVVLLAETATAQERAALARVCLRAGFMWRCHPCKENHFLTTGTCGCGAERPAGLD